MRFSQDVLDHLMMTLPLSEVLALSCAADELVDAPAMRPAWASDDVDTLAPTYRPAPSPVTMTLAPPGR